MPALELQVPHAAPGFLPWIAALVHAHRRTLLSTARRQGLSPEESLDAVQDTFESFFKLPEARGIARDADDAPRLLSVILRHNVANRRRKHGRHARAAALLLPIDDSAETSEALVERAEELARVNGCILRMQALQQRVIRLSLLDEQPHEEIARLLGLTEGHVRVLLHRAREHVRHCDFDAP